MRKLIYIFIFLSFMGCDDFLDVNPKSKVVNDDLFQSDEGFQDALYGVYSAMVTDVLYGKRLAYEYTDISAQYYDFDQTSLNRYDIAQLIFGQGSKAKREIESVWEKMYEAISYNNNILYNLEDKTKEEIRYYDLYKGEALGLRAAMHFDLLRLFAVNSNSSDAEALNRAIPYVMNYSYDVTPFSSVEDVYGFIIKDLKDAEALLELDDNLIVNPRKSGGFTFIDARITHMNLYAVQAMLARVYWQKKDMENASIYAKKVIDSGKFPLMYKTDLIDKLASVMSMEETIWGLYDRGYYVNPFGDFVDKKDRLYVVSSLVASYEVESELGKDYRSDWFDGEFLKLVNYKAVELTDSYNDEDGYMGINMIRIPEMYFIMAEALIDTDNTKAIEYFDAVLEARGIVGLADRVDPIVLTKEMINIERRKEFIGEGQEWFRMKRDYEDIYVYSSGETISGSDIAYKWNYPNIEDRMNK